MSHFCRGFAQREKPCSLSVSRGYGIGVKHDGWTFESSQSRRATNCATPGYLVFSEPPRVFPNGSYCHFSRSSPLVFRPAVRCNAVVARCAEFLSGTVRKCVLSCLLSGCGCDCGSSFWVLLNVLRGCLQLQDRKL